MEVGSSGVRSSCGMGERQAIKKHTKVVAAAIAMASWMVVEAGTGGVGAGEVGVARGLAAPVQQKIAMEEIGGALYGAAVRRVALGRQGPQQEESNEDK